MKAALLVPVALVALTACGSAGATGSGTADAVAVKAGDTSCDLSRTALDAGKNVFRISNTGTKTTEVYVYDGTRIVTEKEDIAPGLDYELTAQLDAGSYEVACKPGQKGDGIRTPITVAASADAPASADPAAAKAVADYRAYVQGEADRLVPLVQGLAAAVKAGDVAKAKALYAPSRLPWEAVEPVAEAFGDLDPKIDAREADLDAGQAWTGWHRIEKALWTTGSTAGLAPVADQLVTDVKDLQGRVATADITPASIGNGAKELLDEVATGKITGEEEAFSHTDLVDVEGNVQGAEKAYRVLQPLVADTALTAQLDAAFARLRAVLATHRSGTGYVSYATVDAAGRRTLAQAVDALGEPLSRLTAAATA